VLVMLPTGRCRNCSVPTQNVLCESCKNHIRCNRCYHYLLTHLYQNDDHICNACQNCDAHSIGRYALDRLIGDRTWTGTRDDMSVSDFIRCIGDDVISTYETTTVEHVAIKYYLEMVVDFQRTTQDGNLQSTSARFFIPTTTSDVENLDINNVLKQFLEKVDAFSGQNNGWTVSKVNYLRFIGDLIRPMVVGTFILTPKHIAIKKAVVNINSLDNYCFQYSVLAGMNVVSINSNYRKDRAAIYKPFMHLLNMDGIQSPVPISSIGKFESQNTDISVNVLYHDGDQIIPIRTSPFTDQRKHHVTLLLMITDNHERFHYLSVQSMSRLVASQVKNKYKCYVCHYCLYPFRKEDQLKQHTVMCRQYQSQQIIYPTPGKDDVLKFTKIHYQYPVPFIIYADFECFFGEE